MRNFSTLLRENAGTALENTAYKTTLKADRTTPNAALHLSTVILWHCNSRISLQRKSDRRQI